MVTAGPERRAAARPRDRDRLPRVDRAAVARRAGSALWRLPARAAAQGAERRGSRCSERPGATLAAVDLEAERARIQQQLPRPVTDEDLASHLMYPRVWLEYARARAAVRGSDRSCRRRCFSTAWSRARRSASTSSAARRSSCAIVASSEPHEDGTRTVFFELNGQPRSVRVADTHPGRAAPATAQGRAGQCAPRRRADAGDGGERCRRGGRAASNAGELLLTLEAMKMETAVRAERRRRSRRGAGARRAVGRGARPARDFQIDRQDR